MGWNLLCLCYFSAHLNLSYSWAFPLFFHTLILGLLVFRIVSALLRCLPKMRNVILKINQAQLSKPDEFTGLRSKGRIVRSLWEDAGFYVLVIVAVDMIKCVSTSHSIHVMFKGC